ncbi:Nose resistant to fluoxetine protein 6 [Aphelenchoides fujianensis]|nr:Nose resistant to fluoxetine protein 6 [Aphelenchoides fujianensis]
MPQTRRSLPGANRRTSAMTRSSDLLRLSILLLFCPLLASSCFLCPYRIPPMPKPLDQIQLPSAEKIIGMSNGLVQLCENKTRLNLLSIREQCKAEVIKLVCSFNEFMRSFQNECPSNEDPNACAKCRRSNAAKYAETSWIQIWLDSFGKMPAGISEGNYHWLGDYEQCQTLKTTGIFNGRYCLVDFAIPSANSDLICDHHHALEVSLGACLPATCSSEESTSLVQHVTQRAVHIRCEAQGQWSLAAVVFVVLIGFWLCALWIATFVHWWTNPKNLSPLATELAFALSLQRNASDCMRTKRSESHNFLAAPGITVLSMVMIVSGYVFYIMMPYLENPAFAYELTGTFMYQPLTNFSFYIDGLLALGALRLALKPAVKTWPAYAVVTLFITTVYNRLGEGPMWGHNDPLQSLRQQLCLDTGFLVALEAQLFIIGSIFLFFSNRNRRTVTYAAFGLCAASTVYVFVLTYQYGMFATLHVYGVFLDKIYLNPLARIAPYFIGLLLPFCFAHQSFNVTISFLCAFLLVFIIWTPYYLWNSQDSIVEFPLRLAAPIGVGGHRAVRRLLAEQREREEPAKHHSVVACLLPVGQTHLLGVPDLRARLPVGVALLHRPIYLTAGSTLLTCAGCVIISYLVAFLIDICISRPFRHLLDLIVNKL